jgi:predicted MFS family arabinose efflux permease
MLGGLPHELYVIALSSFLFSMGKSMTAPILTLHMKEVGATVFQIGSILSIQAGLLIVLRIPFTLIARRIGEKRVLALAFISESAAMFVYGWAPKAIWFWSIPVIQLIATGTFFQLIISITSNLAPLHRQGEAIGKHMTIMSLAGFLGPALCSIMVRNLSFRQIFFTSFTFPLIGLALFWFFTKGLGMNGAEIPTRQTPTLNSLKKIIYNRNMAVLAIIRSLYSTSNHTFLTLFSLYAVNQLGFQVSQVAILFSALGVSKTVIRIPAGSLSDLLGSKRVLLATYIFIVLDFVSLAFFKNFVMVGVSIVFFGAVWGSRAVVEWATVSSLVEPEMKTLAVGALESFWDFGAAFGSFFAGLLSGFLPVPTIILLMAGLNLPSIPTILLLKEKRHEREI